MSDGGKGSAPRPIPNRKTFEDNWDRIFGKEKKDERGNKDSDRTDENKS